MNINLPHGVIGCHLSESKFNYRHFHLYNQTTDRRTSLTTADKYGTSSISPKSGSLPVTTRSSSACAFIWTSGKHTMARRNVWIADMIVSDPAVSVGLKCSVIQMTCKLCKDIPPNTIGAVSCIICR